MSGVPEYGVPPEMMTARPALLQIRVHLLYVGYLPAETTSVGGASGAGGDAGGGAGGAGGAGGEGSEGGDGGCGGRDGGCGGSDGDVMPKQSCQPDDVEPTSATKRMGSEKPVVGLVLGMTPSGERGSQNLSPLIRR
jgi:hypothetical protein